MGAVHKYARPASVLRKAVVQRPDEIWTAYANAIAQHFRMDRVIDQRGDGLAGSVQRLDDMTARIVQLRRIIVVGDFPFRLARRDFQSCRLEFRDGLMDRLGHARANQLQIFWIAGGAALAVRETVAIRGAVSVCGADQDVGWRDVLDRGAHAVAQHGGEPKKIPAHNRHARAFLLEHERAHRQVALLSCRRMARPHAAADRQQRIGRDFAHGDTGTESSGGLEQGGSEAKQKGEQFQVHGSESNLCLSD